MFPSPRSVVVSVCKFYSSHNYTNFTSNFSGSAVCNFVSVQVLSQSVSFTALQAHLSSLRACSFRIPSLTVTNLTLAHSYVILGGEQDVCIQSYTFICYSCYSRRETGCMCYVATTITDTPRQYYEYSGKSLKVQQLYEYKDLLIKGRT